MHNSFWERCQGEGLLRGISDQKQTSHVRQHLVLGLAEVPEGDAGRQYCQLGVTDVLVAQQLQGDEVLEGGCAGGRGKGEGSQWM